MAFTLPNHPAAAHPNPQSLWFQADIAAIVAGHDGQGVVSGCAVSPQAPEALGVTVAAGTVRVGGVVAAVAGGNVALSTADPDAPRVDLIVANNTGALSAIAGTPAPIGAESGPAAPALPSDRVLLAMVVVLALDVTIPATQIVDKRVAVAPVATPRSVAVNATARVGDDVVICTAALTLTLYPVSGNAGRQIRVINDHASATVTIDGNAAETINGQATVTLPAGGIVTLYTDGVKWLAFAAGGRLKQHFRGLRLRTHPDADLAAAQVWMTADEIVMDDGTRLAFSTPVTANIAAAGAGGLDTGAEAASTWYEIYAIAKDDGTKNLLLHRAKDYLQDISVTSVAGGSLTLRDTAARTARAQQFTGATAGGPVEFVDLNINKVGSPTGQTWVEIQSDSGGLPSGTVLATSDKLDVVSLATANAWIRFVFRVPVSVVISTVYHLVLRGNFAISATDHMQWSHSGADSYLSNDREVYDGTTWTSESANDTSFKIYVTSNNTAVTMPATYTKKAKIGYVYNSSGNNFRAFVAREKSISTLGEMDVGSFTATVRTLTDLSAFLPPTNVRVIAKGRNSVAGSLFRLEGVPDGYGLNLGRYFVTGPGINYEAAAPPFETEYQAIYVSVSADTGNAWVLGWEW